MDFRVYDNIVGQEMECILAGETALFRSGLTYAQSYTLDVWTDYEDIPNGLFAVFVRYYQNPLAKDFKYTIKSPANDKVHEPTKERAIVETIKFHEYFNEGILIEAIQSYIAYNPSMALVYEVADYFNVPRDDIDYWFNEAREESCMSMD